jgi:hypothetical protein
MPATARLFPVRGGVARYTAAPESRDLEWSR